MRGYLGAIVGAVACVAAVSVQTDDAARPCLNTPASVAISGAIRTRTGQSMANAHVRILRARDLVDVGRLIPPVSAPVDVWTDDRGEYRAAGLCPGSYVVVAMTGAPAANPDETMDVSVGSKSLFVPTYLGDTSDPGRLATVTAQAGEDRADVDIRLQVAPTARVRGRLLTPDGTSPRTPQMTVTSASQPVSVRPLVPLPHPAVDTSGNVVVDGLRPGRYSILVRTASPDGHGLTALTEVEVDGRDVENLLLPLSVDASLSGRLTWNPRRPPGAADLTRFPVGLLRRSSPSGVVIEPKTTVGSDGAFTLRGIPSGLYRFDCGSTLAARPWTVESVLISGRDTCQQAFEMREGQDTAGVAVTLSASGEFAGALRSSLAERVATVVLAVPADRSLWVPGSPFLGPPARVSADGGFRITGLPAGEYVLGAVSDLDLDATDDVILLGILAKGVHAAIRSGEQRQVQQVGLIRIR